MLRRTPVLQMVFPHNLGLDCEHSRCDGVFMLENHNDRALPRRLLCGPGDVVGVMIGRGRWRCYDSAEVAFGVAAHVVSDLTRIILLSAFVNFC